VIAACFTWAMEPLRGNKGAPLSDRQVQGLELIGLQLKRARLGIGWTQRRLERASGVDQTTISRLENGRLASLRLVRIAALMQALNGTWQIFDGAQPPDPPSVCQERHIAEGT
jgi:transcriptional regulator with XRE-family HTH domain